MKLDHVNIATPDADGAAALFSDLFGLRRLRLANIVVISILGGVFSLLFCGWLVGDFSNSFLTESTDKATVCLIKEI